MTSPKVKYTHLRYGTITDDDPVMLQQDGAATSMVVSTVVGGAVAIDDRVLWCRVDKQIAVFASGTDNRTDDESWSWEGDVTAPYTGTHWLYNRSGRDRTIVLVVASCGGGAPTGADLIFNLQRDSADDLFDAGMAIPDGEDNYADTPDDVDWPDGSHLQVNISQVGSTDPGNGLVVTVIWR